MSSIESRARLPEPLPPELEPTRAQVEASPALDPEKREVERAYLEEPHRRRAYLLLPRIRLAVSLDRRTAIGAVGLAAALPGESAGGCGQPQLTDAETEARLEECVLRLETLFGQERVTE